MIYKFSVGWCSPCKQLSKTLETMGLAVTEVDIDENQELVADSLEEVIEQFENAKLGV